MRLKCEICGEKFDATHSRSWGDHCSPCAGWLRALAKGPFQNFTADYQRLGMVVAYLIKKNELKEDDFIHGVIKGLRKKILMQGNFERDFNAPAEDVAAPRQKKPSKGDKLKKRQSS
mgnify:CR=1 FL=1